MAGGAGVRKEITATEVVKKMDQSRKAGTKHFVITVLSIMILMGAIAAIAVMWAMTLADNQRVLEDVTLKFREANAIEMGLEIAKLMRPLYQIPRAQVDSMKLDTFDLTHASPADQTAYDKAVSSLYPRDNMEYHLDSCNADGTNRKYSSYSGSSWMWGRDSSGNPTDPMVTCTEDPTYIATSIDLPSLRQFGVLYAASVQWVDGAGATQRNLRVFVPSMGITANPSPLDPLSCPALMAASTGSVLQPGFGNFMWYGPYDSMNGWGYQYYGAVPILSKVPGSDPKQIIGYFSSYLSLAFAISPLIKDVLAHGGKVSERGESMLYTSSGVVLGLAPWSGDPLTQPGTIADTNSTWRAMTLYKALQTINARFGTNCPTAQQFFTSDDLLIDLTPFVTEIHGMPPLNEAWCQLTVLPRANIYAEIDKAKSNSVWVMVVAGIAGGVAMSLLAVSMLMENISKNILVQEQEAANREEVVSAENAVESLIHPMCLMHATDFIGQGKLAKHEEMRLRGLLLYLDDVEDVANLKKTAHIIFLSHQWLGNSFPDLDGYHFDAMCQAIEAVKAELAGTKDIYIWADYCSIAQDHRGLQAMAVSSLPVYAATCDSFVIVAPTCTHHDSGLTCTTVTYNQRGWCRAEMLSKVCGSGIVGMYYFDRMETEENQLVPVTTADLDHLSLRIFEGTFTVAQDAETLVTPVLGLYSLILKQKDKPHMQTIYQHIVEEKDRFFPKTITYDNDPSTETVLFGPLVDMMEKHVAETASLQTKSVAPPSLDERSNRIVPAMDSVNSKGRRARASTKLSQDAALVEHLEDDLEVGNTLSVEVEPEEELFGVVPRNSFGSKLSDSMPTL